MFAYSANPTPEIWLFIEVPLTIENNEDAHRAGVPPLQSSQGRAQIGRFGRDICCAHMLARGQQRQYLPLC